MFLYVFENVLEDYTAGMVIIAAESLEDAQKIAFDNYAQDWHDENTVEEFLDNQAGFRFATGVYELAKYQKPGVVHCVWGGG
jgi:hypothetical protein